jgi:tRNA-dihydrouridine synthase 1
MILLLRSMYSRSVADAFQIASFKRPSFRRLAHTTTNSNAALYLPNQPDTPITSIAAPMVAASDYAFRALARHYGCDLAFTQMFHARNLVMDAKNTFSKNHFDLYEYADNIHLTQAQLTFLKGSENVPRWDPMIRKKGPLIVQLAGHDVDVMVRAAHRVLDHTHGLLDGIDVNLGCPQGIARKGHYGAFLMDGQPERVYQILSGLRQSLPASVAVSAKIRLPITDELLDDRIRRLIDTGININ